MCGIVGYLGAVLACIGAILAHIGAVLELSWGYLGRLWGYLGLSWVTLEALSQGATLKGMHAVAACVHLCVWGRGVE